MLDSDKVFEADGEGLDDVAVLVEQVVPGLGKPDVDKVVVGLKQPLHLQTRSLVRTTGREGGGGAHEG